MLRPIVHNLAACLLLTSVLGTRAAAAAPPDVASERADWLAKPPRREPEAEGPTVPRGFVLSADLGPQFSPIYPVPSGEASLLLGGALPVVSRRPGHWVALGYRVTASVGGADILTTAGVLFPFGHRHHLTVQGVAGRRARLAYGAGLGFAAFAFGPNGGAFAAEAEGRIGYVFGATPSIAQGIFGAKLRLSGGVGETFVPFPNLGLFIGVQFGNGLPDPATRARRSRASR